MLFDKIWAYQRKWLFILILDWGSGELRVESREKRKNWPRRWGDAEKNDGGTRRRGDAETGGRGFDVWIWILCLLFLAIPCHSPLLLMQRRAPQRRRERGGEEAKS